MKKAIFALIFFATIFPELVTGSTSFDRFFNIGTFLFLFLGYGIAILLIREFVVREKINYLGLFIIGFAYTILNEGLLAKTILRETGFPIQQFDQYGYYSGVGFMSFLIIGLFHTIYSVMFPIVITHYLFKDVRNVPWLGKKTAIIIFTILMILSTLVFFGEMGGVPTLQQFIILITLMILTAFAGWFWGRKEIIQNPPRLTFKPFWIGSSTFFFAMIILPVFIAQPKLPIMIFIIAFVLGSYLYMRMLKKYGTSNESILLFTLGCYLVTAVSTLGFVFVFHLPVGNPIERLISEVVIIIFTLLFARKIIQRST